MEPVDQDPHTQQNPDASPAKRYRLRAKLGLAFGSTVAFLLVIDVFLAVTDLYPPLYRAYVGEYENRASKALVADPHTGYRMRPKSHRRSTEDGRTVHYFADASGFRTAGPDANVPKAPMIDDAKRIVIVGDSYMWGHRVDYEKTCASLLDAALENCTVTNLAMPNFGIDQMAMSVRHQALPLEPDLVIVGMYSADFNRCFSAFRQGFNKPLFMLDDGVLRLQTREDRKNGLVRWIQRNSRLVSLCASAREPIGHKTGLGYWWALNEAILEMIRTDCRDADVPVVFVHIPSSRLTTSRALARYMDRTEAHYINLVKHPSPPTPAHYFGKDMHFNARGHKYLADILMDWINANIPELQ